MPRRSPVDAQKFQQLSPSCFSARGFFGNDTRELEDIIADDQATLQRLGITMDLLVQALRSVYHAALQTEGEWADIAPGVRAECLACRGRTPSPFPGEGTFPKHQVRVIREKDAQSFTITPLAIHLIEHHGFFQGVGSPFRIDPGMAADMLGLITKNKR
ncbi:hypothetical protein SAMN05660653_01898 [Desulfonatronum thiosulfatophilum]|uniref:Uncharacterized protein n=1 Tax=Desulfonatronum thiosulfatophilum TaxID=617002 RepID=A0A1G6D473_9BACT|nr:hypothetical protein [Desulfonatronum thiosulfatophilum]SDB39880.1 hypothetical protein SAMN05660653_01898 [Desulfonatronum thiosulfatophilum]